jgi:hypothetical protein
MIDLPLTIPQYVDPIARGLLFVLLAAVLGLAIAMPAPPSQASTPIVSFATPALASRPLAVVPLTARQEASTAQLPTASPTSVATPPPTEPPAAQEDAAPTVAPTFTTHTRCATRTRRTGE